MDIVLHEHLAAVYGAEVAAAILPRLEQRLAAFQAEAGPRPAPRRFDQGDAFLITYGDMVRQPGEAPLRTLAHFLRDHARGVVRGVHLLPFYPYTSDDGFSVVDYYTVDPALGSWEDIEAIGQDFRLAFDAVVNHISAHSRWFQGFLRDEDPYRDYFTAVDPAADLSAVFRPRTLPLLTRVNTAAGERYVWTTFSEDQIDLNFANPDVLLAIVDVLLFYAARGAEVLRLDAIAFIWKEIGTRCLHQPEAHRIVQLFRRVFDRVAPQVALLTETNVPHEENISYFGDGYDEAQMVYNFSLPPLVLHAIHTGDATALSRWAAGLETPSGETTFFNFLASHDGIGVTPARGILGNEAIDALARRVEALGGFVSYKNNPGGSQSAYELNINYIDGLGDPAHPDEEPAQAARRFLTAQAIMLALPGVPGIYFHSLVGSRGWRAGVDETGRYRTINRQKLRRDELEAELADPASLRAQVFGGYCRLLAARASQAAFHPQAPQRVLQVHPAVFALLRGSYNGGAPVLCLHNVSSAPVQATIPLDKLPTGPYQDLLGGALFLPAQGSLAFSIAPYETRWIAAREPQPVDGREAR
jgi:glucosylglycerate phosphorylase